MLIVVCFVTVSILACFVIMFASFVVSLLCDNVVSVVVSMLYDNVFHCCHLNSTEHLFQMKNVLSACFCLPHPHYRCSFLNYSNHHMVATLLLAVSESNPDAKRLYDDIMSGYNKLVRPVKNVTDPVTVKFKLKLSQLIDVVSIN